MPRYAVIDPQGVDFSACENWQQRYAVARALGGHKTVTLASGRHVAVTASGAVLGVVQEVDLDHRAFIDWLGGPLDEVCPQAVERLEAVDADNVMDRAARDMDRATAEDWAAGSELAAAGRDDVDPAPVMDPPAPYVPGPMVRAYVASLVGAAAEYAAALLADMAAPSGYGVPAPAGLSRVAAEYLLAELYAVAAREYDAGGLNMDTPTYNRPAAYLATVAAVAARRAAARADMPAAVNDRRQPAPVPLDAPPAVPTSDRVAAAEDCPAPISDMHTPRHLDTVQVLAAREVAGLVVNLCAGGVLQVIDPAAGQEYRARYDRRGAVAGLAGQIPPAYMLPLRVAVADLARVLGAAA